MAKEIAEDTVRSEIELVIGRLSNITLQSTLLERIKEAQKRDPHLRDLKDRVLAGAAKDFTISDMGLLKFQGRICVPMDSEIRQEILNEAHTTP